MSVSPSTVPSQAAAGSYGIEADLPRNVPWWKRSFDLVLAVILLLPLLVIMGVIALLIKATSRGPIFFVQQRVGLQGGTFDLLKFRTMSSDAEERLRNDSELWKKYVENDYKLPEGDDPRQTGIGTILRKTSLDELPQIFNILKGEMSFVGPRPVVSWELEIYGEKAPIFLSARPGITGHWQVSGRSKINYPRRAELELEYVARQGFLFDLWILIKTVPVVLLGRGAH